MKYKRLTTEDKNGVIKGILCGTKKCISEYLPKGCQNCPMFKAAFAQLKTFEDVTEDMNNEPS